ncbi:MAG: hypothetical protein ACRD1C_03865 [Terriglobales bacterium]
MAVTRLIALNGNAGAFTQILASIPARSVQIVEDGSVAGQGLEVQFPADGYATTDTYATGIPITIEGAGHDGICGLPAQNAANGAAAFNYRAADVYCQARSATATATTVRVVESESTI